MIYINNGNIENNEDKISGISNLATDTTFNAKINEIENKIPSFTNLVTTSALTVENNIPNVCDLVNKGDYDAKLSEIKNIYCTSSDYNKLTNNTLDEKTTQKR